MTFTTAHLTPDIQSILSAHHQLWDGSETITYKDQTESSYTPPHGGYHSVVLKNSLGVPHLWITQNMNKSSYGTYSITRAIDRGDRMRITWIVNTAKGEFKYIGRIETYEYADSERPPRIHIETYKNNDVTVIYTTNPAYSSTSCV